MTNALKKGLCSLLLEKQCVMTPQKAIRSTRETTAIKRHLPLLQGNDATIGPYNVHIEFVPLFPRLALQTTSFDIENVFAGPWIKSSLNLLTINHRKW